MTRRFTVLFAGLFGLTSSLSAQYWDTGIFAGVSNYQGELAGRLHEPSEYNLAFGGFGRLNINERFAGKAHFYFGTLGGDDINSGNRERNLSFRSRVYELGLQGEYYILGFNPLHAENVTSPYVFLGVAGFYHNPQAEFEGAWYDLQPLGTEGQNLPGAANGPYSRFQVAIPVGAGLRFSINAKSSIGVEVGLRKTFTDYLDDVSSNYPDLVALAEQNPIAASLSYREPEYDPSAAAIPEPKRGNPDTDDWYFFGGITLSINLSDKRGMDFDKRRIDRSMKSSRVAPEGASDSGVEEMKEKKGSSKEE